MANRKKNCPYCGAAIPSEAMRTWRPFSCPQCSCVVAPRSVYHNLGTVGCLSAPLLCAALGWIASRHWLGVLAGSFVGSVAGFAIANFLIWFLNRLRPCAPVLTLYVLREHPSLLRELASLLDTLAEAESWGSSLESRLSSLREQSSLDDSLVGDAISAAQQFENLLEGKNSHRVEAALKKLPLNELRVELRVIARDLRIAAK